MYKLSKNTFGETVILRFNEDGSLTSMLENPVNTDYQAYLAWLEAGNTPIPADEVTQ